MDNSSNKSNTKRHLKREYIPLLIALLVLVILVLLLIIVIFYKDDKGLIVPDLPEKEQLNVGVFDYDSGKYDINSLDVKDTRRIKVDYNVITEYYKAGVMISNPTLKYSDGEFILKSGIYANDPYVSVINKKGEIDWISKINIAKYDTLSIIDVIKKDDNYHIFAVGKINNDNYNIAIRLNSKGNEEKREVFSEKSKNSIGSVISTKNGFAVITDGRNNIEIYNLSNDYKFLSNPFYLKDYKDNYFKTFNPDVMAGVVKDDTLTIAISYPGTKKGGNYLISFDLNNNKVININPFTELDKIKSAYRGSFVANDDKFYTVYNNIAYSFSFDGKLLKKYDYNSIETSDVKGCEVSEDIPDCKDDIVVRNFHMSDDNQLIVYSITSSENVVIDAFDANLDLKKRVTHSMETHDVDEIEYISSIFKDDKIYEFYSLGIETPSIMVSIIG